MIECDLKQKLKMMEGKIYNTKSSLFRAVEDAGVQLPKGYQSGTRNMQLAEKQIRRYIDFMPLIEIDPSCGKKNAQKVIKVYEQPLPVEDGRGKKGAYISLLKPMIQTMDSFEGQVYELFDIWGVFNKYKWHYFSENPRLKIQFEDSKKVFNPWKITDDMPPGLAKYNGLMSYQNKETLKRALDSLKKEEKVKWRENLYFIPDATNDADNMNSRVLSFPELEEKRMQREECVEIFAGYENSVLRSELMAEADTWKNHDLDEYRQLFSLNKYRLPVPLCATEKEKEAYENYGEFIRQFVSADIKQNIFYLCERENILNKYEIFSNPKYRKKYLDSDKQLKLQILGWEKAWTTIEFEVLEKTSLSSEVNRNSADALALEYISYMDKKMPKEKFWLSEDYIRDGIRAFGDLKPGRLYPLDKSKSATALNTVLKELYLD